LAKEALNMVLSAEAKSNSDVSAARNRCEEIIGNAKTDSENALSSALSAADSECEKIKAENLRKIDAFRIDIRKKCAEQKSCLSSLAESNSNAAVQAVIQEIIC
jgi:vacuolar-type H+-ATPase subunit H